MKNPRPYGEAGKQGEAGGRWENRARETSGVLGDNGGHEAFGVDHESPGVGDEEGGREASGVAENPRGSRQGVGGGIELPQGTDTLRVSELPRVEKTPRVTTMGTGITR